MFSDAYFTPINVPTILKAFVSNMPNILDQVDPIICVSLFIAIANAYIMLVIIPTPTITYKATLTIVPINAVCDFFCNISKSLNANAFASSACL